ncbi:ATP-binding protein [Fredinandcohnia humi]
MNLWNEGFERLDGIHCIAEYKEQIVPENRGNPFIEAIPERLDMDQFFDALHSLPKFDSSFLKFGIEDRLELTRQIKPSFWSPFPSHYDKYRGLYTMIKIGYQSRNPMRAIYNRQFAIGWDKILESGLDENGANIAGNIQTAQSLVEIGISGIGKSKIYERILKRLFPQVIHHSEYKDKKLLMTQVLWLHIECPSGKSVGALCKNFYEKVDELLGSNFYQKYGEKAGNTDNLAKRMVKVAAQINLGVLVIDEIQNVHKAHSGGDERMINFITEIVNTIGVPVIIIGTFKALYLFKNSLANSRRGIPDGYSENIMGLLPEESWEWNELIENLWDLQYTVKYTPLTDELKHLMYYQSLGIPDIAVKLFMHVQSKAIINGGNEQITTNLINEVASKSLRLLQDKFEKIRNGQTSELGELDDIKPDWVSFNEYIKEANHRVNVYGKLTQDHSRSLQKRDKDIILEELVRFALNLVSNPELAESMANQVYEASGGMGDKQGMFAHLAQLALEANGQVNVNQNANEDSLPKQQKTKKTKPLLEENDLRFIVQHGHKKGLSTEEALEEAGFIRECNELLGFCN